VKHRETTSILLEVPFLHPNIWEGLDGSNLGPKTTTVLHGAGDAQSASAMELHMCPKGYHINKVITVVPWISAETMSFDNTTGVQKSTGTVSSSILKGYILWYTPCTPAKSVYFCIDNPWKGPDTMWGSMKYSRKSRSLWPSIRFQFFSSGDEKKTERLEALDCRFTGHGFTHVFGNVVNRCKPNSLW